MADKVPLKSVRNAIQRFETSLPKLNSQLKFHIEVIKTAKRHGNIRALNKEQVAASRTFKLLKNDLKALDVLEGKVVTADLLKFKELADPLREDAYTEIVRFVELDSGLDKEVKVEVDKPSPGILVSSSFIESASPAHAPPTNHTQDDLDLQPVCPVEGPHQELMSLQQTRSTEEDLKQLEATAESWNQLQQDIQDVAEIMMNLSKAVHTQQETIDSIEQNVEVAKFETRQGLLEIIKARRAKFAGIPLAGALVGCVVGGPIGMLAGFKVAGVVTAALGTYVGYRGGSFLRRKVDEGVVADRAGLDAPTLGAYDEEPPLDQLDDHEDDDEFVQFNETEIQLSENYKTRK